MHWLQPLLTHTLPYTAKAGVVVGAVASLPHKTALKHEMFCIYCGTVGSKGSRFCANCGSSSGFVSRGRGDRPGVHISPLLYRGTSSPLPPVSSSVTGTSSASSQPALARHGFGVIGAAGGGHRRRVSFADDTAGGGKGSEPNPAAAEAGAQYGGAASWAPQHASAAPGGTDRVAAVFAELHLNNNSSEALSSGSESETTTEGSSSVQRHLKQLGSALASPETGSAAGLGQQGEYRRRRHSTSVAQHRRRRRRRSPRFFPQGEHAPSPVSQSRDAVAGLLLKPRSRVAGFKLR